MGILRCFLFCFLSAIYLEVRGIDSSVVTFKKTMTNITAIEGGMVVLRCQFTNGVGLKRSWTNGTTVIYADSSKFSIDKRISLDLNSGQEYSIQLRQVTEYDEGQYTCTIYSSPVPQTMSVYLKINVPARFTQDVSPDITLDEGEKTMLTCIATGKPKPQVSWRHLVPSADGIMGTGPYLPLSRITREGDGIYECTADNKIAAPMTHRIRVRVRYPPEMTPRKSKKEVSQALGKPIFLECLATAFPIPKFTWKHYDNLYKGNRDNSRIKVVDVAWGNTVRSKLMIDTVALNDFGQYSCIANNVLGSANGTVHLRRIIPDPTRRPPSDIFGGDLRGRSGDNGDGNAAKSAHSLSKLAALISPLLGLKIISMFDF